MPSKRCCCGGGTLSCLIGEDNFDRADENPVSGEWYEVSGNWGISGNELVSLAEGPLITTHRQPAPTRIGNGYHSRIVVDLVVPSSGDADWKIICAYRGTGDYNWLHLEYDSGTGELTPTFYNNATAVMSTTTHPGEDVWSPTPGDNFTMEICCSDIEWTATNAGLQGDVIWHTCEDCGLAALPAPPLGGQGLLKGHFDNWFHYIHWESNSSCEKCQCFCLNPSDIDDYSCIPDTLTLVLTPDQMDVTCVLDDLELTMYLTDDSSYALTTNRKRWYSETFGCEGETLWFILVCEDDFVRSLSLVPHPILDPDDLSANNAFLIAGARITPSTEECNPLLLEYSSAVGVGLQTCDLDPGPGTGTRPLCCDGCWETDTPEPTWTVTITA